VTDSFFSAVFFCFPPDLVFADMEQTFQSTADCMQWCVPEFDPLQSSLHCLMEVACMPCRLFGTVFTFTMSFVALVVLFLPAFFLLLMVRTTHVEHDSKQFDQRAVAFLFFPLPSFLV
jgi:hypothetical protein